MGSRHSRVRLCRMHHEEHMKKRSNRYKEATKDINLDEAKTIEEAVKLAKATSKVKFDASVEIHLRLGIDTKKSDQSIRGTMVLPHGTGKTTIVAAFVEPDKEAEAKAAGADVVGGEDLVAEIIKTGKLDFDVAIATPAMMPKIAKIAKSLGQRGMMPNPKTETVGTDVTKMVTEQKAGKISFRNDSTGNIHQSIGKVSFSDEQIIENYEALYERIKKLKPAGAQGIFIKNITLTTSMGPGFKVIQA